MKANTAKSLAKIIKVIVSEVVTKIIREELMRFKKQLINEVAGVEVQNKQIKEVNSNGMKEIIPPDIVSKQMKPLSKNPILNEILNQTQPLNDGYQSDESFKPNNNPLNESFTPNNNPLPYRANGSKNITIEEMVPKLGENGAPLRVNANMLPEHVKNALTRDYSDLVKKMNKR